MYSAKYWQGLSRACWKLSRLWTKWAATPRCPPFSLLMEGEEELADFFLVPWGVWELTLSGSLSLPEWEDDWFGTINCPLPLLLGTCWETLVNSLEELILLECRMRDCGLNGCTNPPLLLPLLELNCCWCCEGCECEEEWCEGLELLPAPLLAEEPVPVPVDMQVVMNKIVVVIPWTAGFRNHMWHLDTSSISFQNSPNILLQLFKTPEMWIYTAVDCTRIYSVLLNCKRNCHGEIFSMVPCVLTNTWRVQYRGTGTFIV